MVEDDRGQMPQFSPLVRRWFMGRFGTPTPAQEEAWAAVAEGVNALVIAPTGSGKTLAAFLWAIDQLATSLAGVEKNDRVEKTRVLYVSPLKALGVDVHKNLQVPLEGVRSEYQAAGMAPPGITMGVRSGDTQANERRQLRVHPPDILITTPESLYLMLTSNAAATLSGVDTVIVDEIHALAGTKRGAHLAVSLERLDELLERPATRIGLSATVRPPEEVARFLGGVHPVRVVQPPSTKRLETIVEVPFVDMAHPAAENTALGVGLDEEGNPTGDHRIGSTWPAIENAVYRRVLEARSTIIFANYRGLAERLTGALNDLHAASGGTGEIARSHHGSVAKEQRLDVERSLKEGELKCVVATASLELGIDMGAVEQVIQIGPPPSVAVGLQRIGRAGHQVGEVSRAIFYPVHRSQLPEIAAIVERIHAGRIEATQVIANPLDILAQHTVAAASRGMIDMDGWFEVLRRSAPFHTLKRSDYEAVLDLLAGKYPSTEFSELRPRIIWDREAGTLQGRPGARQLAVMNGGTIPDRGLYRVEVATADEGSGGTSGSSAGSAENLGTPGNLAGSTGTLGNLARNAGTLAGNAERAGKSGRRAGKPAPSPKIGELDEEMVFESRVGDVFVLGTSSWRIREISSDRVRVQPAPGQRGRVPFWHGEGIGRPAELGRAIGALTRHLLSADIPVLPADIPVLSADIPRLSGHGHDSSADGLDSSAESVEASGEGSVPGSRSSVFSELEHLGLDYHAARNTLSYLEDIREATGAVPTDTEFVVERTRDEVGDWQLLLESPLGKPVHSPWALAVGARLRERYGTSFQMSASNEGILIRFSDIEGDPPGAELFVFDAAEIIEVVQREVTGSALFASRFRECAARSLLLGGGGPHQRSPLWQQRHRAARLLDVAAEYQDFPIVAEAARECLHDVYDLPSLVDMCGSLSSGSITLHEITTEAPSPYAQSMLFGAVGEFLYQGDTPMGERRLAALSLDTDLMEQLLGPAAAQNLFDPQVIADIDAELQHLTDNRKVSGTEGIIDLLRILGPLTEAEIAARVADTTEVGKQGAEPAKAVHSMIEELVRARRVIRCTIAGQERVAQSEDAGTLEAMGAVVPADLASLFPAGRDPLGGLLARDLRTRGPLSAAELGEKWGVPPAIILPALETMEERGTIRRGRFGEETERWVGREILERIRRRSAQRARDALAPVGDDAYASFLTQWQYCGRQLHGAEGVIAAVEQLCGLPLVASTIESMVLPQRVADYAPHLLDSLVVSGDIVWVGEGAIGETEGRISLHLRESLPMTLKEPNAAASEGSELCPWILQRLENGAAVFGHELLAECRQEFPDQSDTDVIAALWHLAWNGLVTSDSLAALRAAVAPGAAHKVHRPRPRARTFRAGSLAALKPTAALVDQRLSGRWSLVPRQVASESERYSTSLGLLLDRYGVVSRGSVIAEGFTGGFASAYEGLSQLETAGFCRRGHFVEGISGAQFATVTAVDLLRSINDRGTLEQGEVLVLSASDPAQPYGAALPWPSAADLGSAAPRRNPGALVIVLAGRPILYLERGGKTALTFEGSDLSEDRRTEAARELVATCQRGRINDFVIELIDGVHPRSTSWFDPLRAAGFNLTPRGLAYTRPPA